MSLNISDAPFNSCYLSYYVRRTVAVHYNKFNLTSYATLTKVQELQQWFDKLLHGTTDYRTEDPSERRTLKLGEARRRRRTGLGPGSRRGEWSTLSGRATGVITTTALLRHLLSPPHCNCDPISPHSPQFHSFTDTTTAGKYHKQDSLYPHMQQQVRTTNWGTPEHHIYQ